MKNLTSLLAFFVAVLALVLSGHEAPAVQSEPYRSDAVTAHLVTAQNGVPEGAKTVSAALHLVLGDGWKTYWRSPGEVGIPPSVDWSASSNVKDVVFFWPAPTRFRAFGIENFGYLNEVAFPLQVTLKNAGEPLVLRTTVDLLVCSTICVPKTFDLSLALDSGTELDRKGASLIASFSKQVPGDGSGFGLTFEKAGFSEDKKNLVVTFQSNIRLDDPDIFPEMGPGATFGAPDIRLGEEGRLFWASLPILSWPKNASGLNLTLTDNDRAATFSVSLSDIVPEPPYTIRVVAPGMTKLVWIVLIAVLGGFILNLMPCVLPVLSIKLGSAMKAGDRTRENIRIGFLMSAAGEMAFMWLLAGVMILAKNAGLSVGWGLQFQNPVFLVLMITILVLFSANLFGLYEFRLPDKFNQSLSSGAWGNGYLGDFSTGAFAAVLATPCSAPFLGTAVAFALSGRSIDILMIFTALGVGLALPYFAVAAMPRLVQLLPRPGRWMIWLKVALGLLLAGTATWLVWVLSAVAGSTIAVIVSGLMVVAVLLISLQTNVALRRFRIAGPGLMVLSALAVVTYLQPSASVSKVELSDQSLIPWQVFDRAAIARLVSEGNVVFVDVTADWCITCKANKALVIERGEVAKALDSPGVIPMVADWTRSDEEISRYLKSYNRYGIPFNIIYGPSEPEGIVLPEILTTENVMDAIEKAGKISSPSAQSTPEF